jgi:alpha-L-rhamnosidase
MTAFEKATWVKVSESKVLPKGERPAYWVSKDFDSQSGTAVISLSAQGLYRAYLNGERIGSEELTPGSTQYKSRIQFQTFAVRLAAGLNRIEILVADGWFRGCADIAHSDLQFGEHVAVIAEIKQAGKVVVCTDSTWLSSPSHIISADLFLGQNEDKNLVDHRSWSQVETIKVAAHLVPPIAPPVRKIQELPPQSIRHIREGVFLVDFGQNINGWCRLNRLGPKGNKTTLTHGEFLDQHGNLDRSHLDVNFPMFDEPVVDHQIDTVVSAGVEGDCFEPMFTTHGFQYVLVEGFIGALTPSDICAYVVHTDLLRIGNFESSDPNLTWLHDATVWSFRDNACDVPTDCPTRERAGWTGDWQIFVEAAAFIYDVDAFSRKWLADVVLDQRSDGRIANVSPELKVSGPDSFLDRFQGSAGWGDVIVHAPYATYWAYGRKDALNDCFEAMERWINYGLQSAKNQRDPQKTHAVQAHEEFIWDTGFHHGEWLEPGDSADNIAEGGKNLAEIATAYLYRSSREFAEIAKILGKPDALVHKYEQFAVNVLSAWRAEFLDDSGLPKTQKQSSFARALNFGLIREEHRRQAAAVLGELISQNGDRLSTGFLSTGFLLPALAENGQAKKAFDVLFQTKEPSWLYLKQKGATTLWEQWDGINSDGRAEGSLNHYSKGSAITFLHHYVAGLKPLAPGYEKFIVEPILDHRVPDARVELDTPFGKIRAGWTRLGQDILFEVESSPGASGQLKLPDGREIAIAPSQTVSEVFSEGQP